MKTTIATALAIFALTGTMTLALPNNNNGPKFGGDNTNTNTNNNAANSSANSSATASAAASAAQQQAQQQGQAQGQLQGQLQGQGQTQSANNNNVINFEAGVGGIAVGAAMCANAMSIGVPGGSIGYSFSDKDCKIIAEAQALAALGLIAEARTHLTHIGRINQSVRLNQRQATAPSTSLSYVTCRLDEATNQLTVRQASGFTFERASADCLAAHGF